MLFLTFDPGEQLSILASCTFWRNLTKPDGRMMDDWFNAGKRPYGNLVARVGLEMKWRLRIQDDASR